MPKTSVLDELRAPRVRVNWKTHRPVQPSILSPSSARQASHRAGEPITFVDHYSGSDHFSRSGLISNKAGRLFAMEHIRPEPIVVPRSGFGNEGDFRYSFSETPSSAQTERSQTPDTTSRLAALRSGFLKEKTLAQTIEESLPVLGRQLLSGDQLEVIEAVITLLQIVQGDNNRAEEFRRMVGEHPGILASLVRALKICDNPYKHVIYQTLSQLVFNNHKNALSILHVGDIFQQVYEASHTGIHDIELEVARMLNNVAATSAQASSAIVGDSRLIEALKRLCQSQTFAIRSRAVGAINVLSRHPHLLGPLQAANVAGDCLANISKEGGTKEELQLFRLTVTCAVGNLMGTIERKSWTADADVMSTAVLVLQSALQGNNFAGVSCPLTPVLQSIRSLAVSRNNQILLVGCGAVEQLVPYLEGWVENPGKELNDQLASLELALALLLALSPAPSCKLKLRSTGFGPCLFNIRRTKPSQAAVSLAHKLIDTLHIVEEGAEEEHDRPTFDVLSAATRHGSGRRSAPVGFRPRAPPAPMGGRSEAPTGMLGMSDDSFDEANLKGGSDAGWGDRQVEIFVDRRREAGSVQWFLPARRACVRMFQVKIASGWQRLVTALKELAIPEEKWNPWRMETPTMMRGELYQLLGRHRVWLEGEDWEELLAGSETTDDGLVDPGAVALAFERTLWPKAAIAPHSGVIFAAKDAVRGDKAESSAKLPDQNQGARRISPQLVERILGQQMGSDLSRVLHVLSAEEAGDGEVAMQTLRGVTNRLGWALDKGEWARLQQTLDAKGRGRARISEFSDMYREAVVGEGQARGSSRPGEMVRVVAKSLEAEARVKAGPGSFELEHVTGGFHTAARLEKLKVRAVRGRTSRMEAESVPLSPVGRRKNSFLLHKPPAMPVRAVGHDNGHEGGAAQLVAKEAVNSFASVQGYVPRPLRPHVASLPPEREGQVGSAEGGELTTTYHQHYGTGATVFPFRDATRPLGHGGEWGGPRAGF